MMIYLFVTEQSFLIQNKNSRTLAGQDKLRNVFCFLFFRILDLPSDVLPPLPVNHLQTSCFSFLWALIGWRSWFLGDGV